MPIGYPPQREERTLETLSCPKNPTLVARCFKEFFLYFSSPYFQFSTIKTSLFLPNLKIQIEFTILALTANHLCEENPSLCSTLEPLYCSSYATAIGGIKFINFVDSGPLTVTRISCPLAKEALRFFLLSFHSIFPSVTLQVFSNNLGSSLVF